MYVIFPADELILMTYGPAIPRIKPRPTLDCLAAPRVPFVLSERHLKQLQARSLESASESPSTLLPYLSGTRQLSSRQHQQQAKLTTAKQTAPLPMQNYNDPNMRSSSQQAHSRLSREHSPAVGSGSQTPSQSLLPYNSAIEDDSISTRAESFDYTSRFVRDRSPSVLLEPPTPEVYGPDAFSNSRPVSPSHKPKSPQTKSKLRPKIHLSLGRLGRQQTDRTESNRLREDLHIHVENPTFTRENLRERNFDAFFESGEPVYKLQPKLATTAPATSGESGESSFCDVATLHKTRSTGDGGLFAPSPKESMKTRSRSAEHDTSDAKTSGASQKGDRFFGKIFKWSKRA